MAAGCRQEFKLKNFGFGGITDDHFYVSQWSDRKAAFVVYRLVLFVYWATMTAYSMSENLRVEGGYSYFIYLSSWGEWGILLNFGLALGVAVYGALAANMDEKGKVEAGPLRWFHKMYWMVQAASAGGAYVITIVFWTALGVTQVSLLVNVHRHALNSALVTLDIFVSKVPIRLLHFIYPVAFGLSYTGFTLVLHLAGVHSTFYPLILDWENSPAIAAGVIVGCTFVVSPLVHSVTYGLYQLRLVVAKACGCTRVNEEKEGLEIHPSEMKLMEGV